VPPQTPAAYRSTGSHNSFKQANLLQDASLFDVLIEPLDVTHCASVSHQGSYMQINQAMATLFGVMAQHELLGDTSQMMAVFLDDPDTVETEDLRSAACCSVDQTTPT